MCGCSRDIGMENNESDYVNRVDSDVLLPPRKRLLAGFKRVDPVVNMETRSCGGNEFDLPMNYLLRNHPSLSIDEIVVASRKAWIEASKVASAARIVADEKAAVAAKARAAAKIALESVLNFDEGAISEGKQSKNKTKHVAVDSLYGKRESNQNYRSDEELARKLHQVINSSPRISMNISTDPEPKKHKISPSERTATHNGGTTVFKTDHTIIRNEISCYNDSYDRVVKEYNDGTKFRNRDDQTFDDSNRDNQLVNIGNVKAGTVFPENRVRVRDDGVLIGHKKWNNNPKKLPLSKDYPKENLEATIMPACEDYIRKPTTTSTTPLFSNVASRDERFLDNVSLLHWIGG